MKTYNNKDYYFKDDNGADYISTPELELHSLLFASIILPVLPTLLMILRYL